jgi:hypothetical protein
MPTDQPASNFAQLNDRPAARTQSSGGFFAKPAKLHSATSGHFDVHRLERPGLADCGPTAFRSQPRKGDVRAKQPRLRALDPIYYIRRNATDGIKRYFCFTFAATLLGLDAGARLRQLPFPSAAASRETRPPAESGKCALPFVCLRRISTAARGELIHFHSKKNNLQGPRMPFVRAPTTENRKRSEKEPNSFRSVVAPETHCA